MLKLAINVIERLTVIQLFINSLFTSELYPRLSCKMNRGEFNLDIDTIISQLETPVIVAENISKSLIYPATLIFLNMDEIESISNPAEKITSSCTNYEARVIVIVDRYVNETELNSILEAFKIKLHLHLTVLYPHEEQTSHMMAAFHNPFEMNKFGVFNGTNYFYVLNETTAVKVADEIRSTTKYLTTQVNGFPINISTFCTPYIFEPCNSTDIFHNLRHVQKMKEVSEFMNWTTVITLEADYDKYLDGMSKNPLQVLREKSSTDIFVFDYLRRDLKPTECFLRMSSQNTCPVSTKIVNPRWKNLKTIFDSPTCSLIFSTILTCIVFFRIVTFIRLSKSSTLNQGSTFKILQSICSVTNIDRRALICSQQILWPFWILFVVIITNTVTSSLGMKMILKTYSKPIPSFKDAVKFKVPVVDEFNLLDETSVAPYIAELAKQKVQTECCYNLLFNESLGDDTIYFLSDRTKSLIIDIFGSVYNCPFYRMDEYCLGESLVGYVMSIDFPFMERVTELVQRFEENGIFSQMSKLRSHLNAVHRKDFLRKEFLNNKKLSEMHHTGYSELKALTFNDLFLPFAVLILGHIISLIILVTEFIVYRMKSKTSNYT